MTKNIFIPAIAIIALLFLMPAAAITFPSPEEIRQMQASDATLPVGERIALWAERFVGTPYDTDPLGAYVTRAALEADDAVDCMYLTFRSTELALSNSPAEALQRALELRFHSRGLLDANHRVTNYDDRYDYALDMLSSGKWGRDITPTLGSETVVPGSRGHNPLWIIPAAEVPRVLPDLRSGDIVYFVKDPARRVVGEVFGHVGILKREGQEVYLIHASGLKTTKTRTGGGVVKKLPLAQYAAQMNFVGIVVGRLPQQ